MDIVGGKNLRSEQRVALKQANKQWTDCVVKNFLGDWLAGKNLSITEVCQDELSKMQELDSANYPTMPFKL